MHHAGIPGSQLVVINGADHALKGTVLLWVYDRNAIDPERHIPSGINLLLEGIQIKRKELV